MTWSLSEKMLHIKTLYHKEHVPKLQLPFKIKVHNRLSNEWTAGSEGEETRWRKRKEGQRFFLLKSSSRRQTWVLFFCRQLVAFGVWSEQEIYEPDTVEKQAAVVQPQKVPFSTVFRSLFIFISSSWTSVKQLCTMPINPMIDLEPPIIGSESCI